MFDPRWDALAEVDALTAQAAEPLPPFRLSPKERQRRRTRCGRHVPRLSAQLAALIDEVPALCAVGVSGEALRTRRERVAQLEGLVARLRDLADWSADLLLRERSALQDDCQAVLAEARLLARSRVLGGDGARVAAKLAGAEALLQERQAGIEKERQRRARLRALPAAERPRLLAGAQREPAQLASGQGRGQG